MTSEEQLKLRILLGLRAALIEGLGGRPFVLVFDVGAGMHDPAMTSNLTTAEALAMVDALTAAVRGHCGPPPGAVIH